MDVSNKTVTILGAKRSGFALARLVYKLGGIPRISDQSLEENIDGELLSWADHRGMALELGRHTEEFILNADILALSPGVSIESSFVQAAIKKGIPVLGEIEFAAQYCQKPIIAITGSNGKTTVSTLTAKMLESAGYKVRLCGNVGVPFSDYCLENNEVDYFVLEISSFQMESLRPRGEGVIKGFCPQIAILLNFNENHLDRHKDLDDYFTSKIKIFQNQTVDQIAILNADDPRCAELVRSLEATCVLFSREMASNPNFAAVYCVADVLKIESSIVDQTIQDFKGVEHRLEWIRSIDGVDFINDSKATTAEAGRWALERIEQPVMMICGGRDKNIDFSVLKTIVQQKVKRIFAIGEAREKIRKTFEGVVDVEECEELGQAVLKARESADSGDCVVLSPMCASFDMYKDYEERGRVFKGIVENLT